MQFCIFLVHGKNGLKLVEKGSGGFFPTNLDLANILGRTDFDFENFYFLDFFGSQISGLGPAWARAWAQAWARAWARLGPGLGPGLAGRPGLHDLL